MPEFDRLDGSSIEIQLEFVEREQTLRELMQLSIQLQLRGLSLSDTVAVLESFGVERARSTIHNWVQKADPQPSPGAEPNHVALDETVIHLDEKRYWLYAAVDPETNKSLHYRLFSSRNEGVISIFLSELTEKHNVDNAVFLVDFGIWLKAALDRHGLRFRHETHGNRNAVERVFQEVKRRTYQFGNWFRNAEPNTAETRLHLEMSPLSFSSLVALAKTMGIRTGPP